MAPGGIADPIAALALADRALEAIPDREIYMVRRGAVLYRIGRVDEAIAELNRVAQPVTEQERAAPNA